MRRLRAVPVWLLLAVVAAVAAGAVALAVTHPWSTARHRANRSHVPRTQAVAPTATPLPTATPRPERVGPRKCAKQFLRDFLAFQYTGREHGFSCSTPPLRACVKRELKPRKTSRVPRGLLDPFNAMLLEGGHRGDRTAVVQVAVNAGPASYFQAVRMIPDRAREGSWKVDGTWAVRSETDARRDLGCRGNQ